MRPTPSCLRIPRPQVRRALLGRRVVAVQRHGKHLWLELDRRPWLGMHFGMAGGLQTPQSAGVKLVSHGKGERPPGWPPRFTKLHLTFADGGELVLADGRRLGRVRLRRDPRNEPPIGLLGFDALLELPTPARFAALVAERGAPIKALLLDQTFAAGVGNWIADEVLYQARIAPGRRARLAVPAGSRSASARDQARRRDRGQARIPTATATRRAGSSTIAGAETRLRSPRGASAFATTRSAAARPPGSPPSSTEVDLSEKPG